MEAEAAGVQESVIYPAQPLIRARAGAVAAAHPVLAHTQFQGEELFPYYARKKKSHLGIK